LLVVALIMLRENIAVSCLWAGACRKLPFVSLSSASSCGLASCIAKLRLLLLLVRWQRVAAVCLKELLP
jgi:hypothetical protein